MYQINVSTIDGTESCDVYNIHDFPWEKLIYGKAYKKGKNPTYYINMPCAFDIETTTLAKYNIQKHDGSFYGESFMYQWQICLDKYVVFGRTWEEFTEFINITRENLHLSDKLILPIYVHNLAYEFQFMKDFLNFQSVFAKEKHKVMKAYTSGIEFRCSYYLSNMSLAKFCENTNNVKFYKLVDTYDYRKTRTPKTQLTEEEQAYCYCDVRGLCECIRELMKEDTLASIPLTNTGYVRREYRHAMKTKDNIRNFKKLALTRAQYDRCKRAFRGGNTHANRRYTNKTVWNVYSYDLSSSYPGAILLDYYPMGKFTEVTLDTQEKLDYYTSKFCVVMDISLYNVSVKDNIAVPYIDVAHCYKRSNIRNDNGRVLSADYVEISLTEIDLDIIRRTYDYDGLQVNGAMYATRGKLPAELRQKCLDYFRAKSELKGVEGKEYEYLKSKNRINSTFGMMVTDLIHSEIIYEDGHWIKVEADEHALEKYYNNKNSFLHYQWGIYVTAQARKRLQQMLDIVGNDVVYIDTDSIKFVNISHIAEFEEMNKEIEELINNSDIKPEVIVNGKKYQMGVWDFDGQYIIFKTLGAKKYCDIKYEQSKNETKFETTVAGMSKKLGAANIKCPANFAIGREMEDIGRTTAWYNDSAPHQITVNGDTFLTASNVGILDTTYTLGVTNEYWEVLKEFVDFYV